MAKQVKNVISKESKDFKIRSFDNRVGSWGSAVVKLIAYLMSIDPESDTLTKKHNAEEISRALALEIGFNKIGFYWIGIVQPLKEAIIATTLIDETAKGIILSELDTL